MTAKKKELVELMLDAGVKPSDFTYGCEYVVSDLAIDDVFHQIGFKTEISFLDERIIEVFDTINNLNGEFIYYAQENNNQQLSDFFDEYQIDQILAESYVNSINRPIADPLPSTFPYVPSPS